VSLRSRFFLPLFVTQFLGAFNDNLFKSALVMLLAFDAALAAGSGADAKTLITLASGLFILPFFLFSAPAGQIADYYDKAKVVRAVKAAEIPVMALGAFGLLTHHLWTMMAALALTGVQSAFFGPVKYGILPQHLKEKELVSGNAWIETGTFLAILLGTIAGGLFVRTDGGKEAVAAGVVLLAALGFAAARFVPPAPPVTAHDKGPSLNVLRSTWAVMAEARRSPVVWRCALGISWFWLLGASYLSQLPLFVRSLGGDETVVTLFLAAFSVGVACGSLSCNALLKGRVSAAYAPWGAAVMAAAGVLLIALAKSAAPLADPGWSAFLADPLRLAVTLCLFLVAAGGGLYAVPLYALMQASADPDYRARAVAANNIVNALAMTLSTVAVLALYALGLGVEDALLLVALGNLPVAWAIGRGPAKPKR
jgi:acyl-[acyl-carrier-protein]-phospholipid O-acyltransferase/long-chain-fatty-acid--[acyl-carrier-protein] ligase